MKTRGILGWVVTAAALLGSLACAPAAAQGIFQDVGRLYLQQGTGQRGEAGDANRRREHAERRQAERRNTLTPDERRELNRDLQRANREIYRKGRDNR
ncbi:MAG: hypothetical protein IT531_19445 [Burkholderiales bacterium]|nr:hypothetical protein [Burkholderiales bacterium]